MQKDRLRYELVKAREELQRQIDVLSIPSIIGGGFIERRSDKDSIIELLQARLKEIERELRDLNPNSASTPKP